MLHIKLPQGIQGANRGAVPAFRLQVKAALFKHAPLQQHSDSRKRHLSFKKLPLTRLIRIQASTADLATSIAPDAVSESSPVTAIVLGASIAGLLSAAALSDNVESVIVLDKDAFVSEELPPDKLKEVMLSASVERTSCRSSQRGKTYGPLFLTSLAIMCHTALAMYVDTSKQFMCSNSAALGMST